MPEKGGTGVKVEIWSDVVCPWCYVGKRYVEAALARFPQADEVAVEWHSFELEPRSPARVHLTLNQVLQRRYGMSEEQADRANRRMTDLAADVGLEYRLSDVRVGNTFDAHRLVHLAAAHGLGGAMEERLFAAYFTEGRSVSEPESLAALAEEVGLERTEAVAVLASDRFGAEVRADEATASAYGASGVPFVVVDGRYGIAGAQPPDVILAVLDRAWSEAHPTVPGSPAGTEGVASGAQGTEAVPRVGQPDMP